ncbi:MAG: hypothetical protein JRD04_02215 [Deltaproteobacteria bacterium]|nr:hypothetical protein [Deltaproteobacteria bacterium]
MSEIVDAAMVSIENQSLDAIQECLSKWEDTVEILSIPGMKERAWEQFEKLKARGCIN